MKQLQVIKEALNIATQKGAFNLDEAHIIKTNLEQAENMFQELGSDNDRLKNELENKEATIQTLKSNVDKVMALKDDPLKELKYNIEPDGAVVITKKPTKS